MQKLWGLLAVVWGALASPVQADDTPVVVELFTSQGCSSCPPADEILASFAGRDDVIALALHVDYWDYIGWKDKFAQAAHTKRQKGYARALGKRAIYTPQMVINGRDDVIGNKPMEVTDLIRRHGQTEPSAKLELHRKGGRLLIQADPARLPAPADVFVVTYTPRAEVNIKRGENAGRKLSYSHIVTGWTDVGDWKGRRPLSVDVDLGAAGPVVVILQQKGYGPILAASRLR